EILERGGSPRCLGRGRRSNWFCCLGQCGRNLRRLPPCFPLFFLDDFLAQFPFSRKRAPVDNAKRFFLFVIGQGTFLSDLSPLEFITGCQLESLRRPCPLNLRCLSKLRLHRKVERLIQSGNS